MTISTLRADRLRTGSRRAIAAGGVGFVLGVLFWQFSGLHAAIGRVAATAPAVAHEDGAGIVAKLEGRFTPVAAPACTTLALNRTTGQTLAGACQPAMGGARNARLAGREDRAASSPQPAAHDTADDRQR